jgi:hypothetical protein
VFVVFNVRGRVGRVDDNLACDSFYGDVHPGSAQAQVFQAQVCCRCYMLRLSIAEAQSPWVPHPSCDDA